MEIEIREIVYGSREYNALLQFNQIQKILVIPFFHGKQRMPSISFS